MSRDSEKNSSVVKPYQKYIFILTPFLLIGLIFLFLYKKPLYIIRSGPGASTAGMSLTPYDDRSREGHSQIKVLTNTSSNISYQYILKEGFTFPYIGISFTQKDSSLFDLSAYDDFRIKIKATAGTRVPVTITSDIPGYSNPALDLSYRNSQSVLTVSDQLNELSVPIKNFETADWWYAANNKTEKDLDAPDFSKVLTIQFGNCINIKKEVEDTITIEEISFHVNLFFFYMASALFTVLYFIVGLLFFYRKKKVSKTEINFQYEKIDVVNHLDKEEEAVFGFITSNYFNPELTIIDVQTSIGLHERKISAIIKKKTELNFKQFLNKLRISEAKRLLSETDLQISEIAFKVGYGNASHFNRVFKSTENCSPNDFRKEHSTAR